MDVIKEQQILGKNFKMYGTIHEPLFLARDVAQWLGQRNGYTVARSVSEDQKLQHIMCVSGDSQPRTHVMLTEFGLYEVLMLNRSEFCKNFRNEVSKILKQIRLEGYYLSIEMIEKLKQENSQVLEQLESVKLESRDALDFINSITKSNDNITMLEMARVLSKSHDLVGRNKLFNMLRNNNVLMKNNTPYQKYINQGYFEVTEIIKNGKVKFVTLITPKGQIFINKLYKNS